MKRLLLIVLFISVGFSESALEAAYGGFISVLAITIFFGIVRGLIYLVKYIFGVEDKE